MRPDFQTLDELAKRLADALPESLKSAPTELEHQFRTILEKGLAKMDLVTRQEFEAQKKVLARAEQKLAQLEEKLKNTGSSTESG